MHQITEALVEPDRADGETPVEQRLLNTKLPTCRALRRETGIPDREGGVAVGLFQRRRLERGAVRPPEARVAAKPPHHPHSARKELAEFDVIVESQPAAQRPPRGRLQERLQVDAGVAARVLGRGGDTAVLAEAEIGDRIPFLPPLPVVAVLDPGDERPDGRGGERHPGIDPLTDRVDVAGRRVPITGRVRRVIPRITAPLRLGVERRGDRHPEGRVHRVIEAQARGRRPMGVEGVPVHRDTAPIGGKVVDVVPVSKCPTYARGRRQRESRLSGRDAVAPATIEFVGAIGAIVGSAGRPAQSPAAPARRPFRPQRPERTTADCGVIGHRATPLASEDLDHPRERVGTVEHARRTAHHLDPFHIVEGQRVEVERASRLVHRHPVDQHLHVVALAPPEEERGLAPERPAAHDRRAGHFTERIRERAHAARAERVALKDGHTATHHAGGKSHPFGGHHEGSHLIGGIVRRHLGGQHRGKRQE